MTVTSLLLVILASFIHASWNLLAKRAASVGPVFVFAYSVVACVAYAPWVLYIFANGSVAWAGTSVAFILLSGAIHLGYSLCLQRGYQVADLSVVYPVARGTGPMLSTLGAILLLGEAPTSFGQLGLVMVVSGIVIIATQGNLSRFRQANGQLGVRWGTATGAFIPTYTVVDGFVVKTLGIAPVLLDWFSNLLRFFLLAPLCLRIHADPSTPCTAIGGLLSELGFFRPFPTSLCWRRWPRARRLALSHQCAKCR
jgi:drug/metabolite transporter (DMT)-like permease